MSSTTSRGQRVARYLGMALGRWGDEKTLKSLHRLLSPQGDGANFSEPFFLMGLTNRNSGLHCLRIVLKKFGIRLAFEKLPIFPNQNPKRRQLECIWLD